MNFPGKLFALTAIVIFGPFFSFAQSSSEIRCSIKAEPGRLSAGEYVTLSWSSFGATSAFLAGIGNVPTSGSRTMQLATSEKFTLTVRNDANHHTCWREVAVTPRAPTCFISAWPQTIESGSSATITWSASNASTLFITGLGGVPPSGARIVSPTRSTSYTLTANGIGVPCTQTTHVNVTAKTSAYGYIPHVASVLYSPFVPNIGSARGSSGDSSGRYYDDVWYYDTYDNSDERDYRDVYYVDEIETDDCNWWDYWCSDEYDFDNADTQDTCLWDWWCGDYPGTHSNEDVDVPSFDSPCSAAGCPEYSSDIWLGGGEPDVDYWDASQEPWQTKYNENIEYGPFQGQSPEQIPQAIEASNETQYYEQQYFEYRQYQQDYAE